MGLHLEMLSVTSVSTSLPLHCPQDSRKEGRCEMRNKKFMALLSFPASFHPPLFVVLREQMPVLVDACPVFNNNFIL